MHHHLSPHRRLSATHQDGKQPLHAAAINGHVDVIRALLAAGADRGARTHVSEQCRLGC